MSVGRVTAIGGGVIAIRVSATAAVVDEEGVEDERPPQAERKAAKTKAPMVNPRFIPLQRSPPTLRCP